MIPLIISAIEEPDDREFMEFLYNSYHRLIYSEILKHVTNGWDVEDIAQAVIEKLIGKISTLRGFGRSQQINYIIVAARHTALNFLRDNKRTVLVSYDEESDWIEDSYLSADDRLERIELLEDAGRAWRALDEKSRYLLEMKYILDMSNEEIAREIGVAPDSVRMLLSRARKKIKENMKEMDTD